MLRFSHLVGCLAATLLVGVAHADDAPNAASTDTTEGVSSDTSSSEPATLDYVAPAECPDAARFTAEVSARLGRVPFEPDQTRLLRVRFAADGEEWLATVELPEGGARVARGPTCADAFALTLGLVAEHFTAAAPNESPPNVVPNTAPSVDAVPAPPATPEATAPPTVPVRFGLQSNERQPAIGVYREDPILGWRRLCVAPCEAGLERAFHVLGVRLNYGEIEPMGELGGIRGPTDLLVVHRSRRRVRLAGWALVGVGLVVTAMSLFPAIRSVDEPRLEPFAWLTGGGVTSLTVGFILTRLRDRLSTRRAN
ncbi:MAG: hypothetical protein R3B99_25510 [Polyangiales bacterium]|nr:hypothetical protein [Myxococcales bacterium]